MPPATTVAVLAAVLLLGACARRTGSGADASPSSSTIGPRPSGGSAVGRIGARSPVERQSCELVNETFYFPAGVLTDAADASDLDVFRRGWYSRALHAMGEPSLSCGSSAPESYRFLWLRTWGRPVAVRFRPDAVALDIVELDGAGGHDPGKVLRKASAHLGPADSKALQRALEVADIWRMPSESTRMGLDGAQWILEARRDGEYRVIDRWSPEPGPFRALCELLIRQAGVQIDSGANALY